MSRVVQILMDRDGLTESEAMEQIAECRDALERGEFDAMSYYLGLEDDYIFDIL